MFRRATGVKFWLWIMLAGLAGAAVGGWCEAMLPTTASDYAQQHYFESRLFATGFSALAGYFNRWVPYTLAAVFLIAMAYLAGKPQHHLLRRLVQVIVSLSLLTGLIVYSLQQAGHLFQVKHAVLAVAISLFHLLSGPAGLMIPLAILLWIYWRLLRRRHAGPIPRPDRKRMLHLASSFRRAIPWRPIGLVASGVVKGFIGLLAATFCLANLAALALPAYARRTVRTQPNIIFIMVDTLRADHMGCYGYDLPTTPNIDRFARDSTRFAAAIAPSSWTAWSVHGIFTSQYPDVLFTSHTGVMQSLGIEVDALDISYRYGAPLRFTTLAEVLRERGYTTNAVVSNPWLQRAPGNTQGYSWYDDAPSRLNATCRATSPQVTRSALDRMREVKAHPFFLYLLYMDPHEPYEQYAALHFPDSSRDLQREPLLPPTVSLPQRRERRANLRRYNSEIAYTDRAVGELLAGIKRLGLYDDTLIVFFSDHGEEFREHGDVGHSKTVYDEVIQVPLIIKLPGQRQGRVIGGTFPLLDLYPSLLAYLGYPVAHLGLRGEPAHWPSLLRCREQPIFAATDSSAKCIVHGRRKYIYRERPAPQQEYFELATDPLERRNLLAHSPTAADDLIAHFTEWDRQNALLEIKLARPPADRARLRALTADDPDVEALTHQLRSLGYLQGGHKAAP